MSTVITRGLAIAPLTATSSLARPFPAQGPLSVLPFVPVFFLYSYLQSEWLCVILSTGDEFPHQDHKAW